MFYVNSNLHNIVRINKKITTLLQKNIWSWCRALFLITSHKTETSHLYYHIMKVQNPRKWILCTVIVNNIVYWAKYFIYVCVYMLKKKMYFWKCYSSLYLWENWCTLCRSPSNPEEKTVESADSFKHLSFPYFEWDLDGGLH